MTRVPKAIGLLIALISSLVVVAAQPAQAAASVVRVTGSQGNWQLTVDGAPFQVKGLTWGPPVGEAAAGCPTCVPWASTPSAPGAPTAPACRCSTPPRPTASR